MVVFTCNHCGESLQKPKVEKHYSYGCRKPKNLTCVDCFKDFRAEEYTVHTKCITEEERYSARGTYANGIVKKGDVKQESWVSHIRGIIDKEISLNKPLKDLLITISKHNNIPRKKPKFMNYLKSSLGGRANMKHVEDVWNIIEKHKAQLNESNTPNPSESNGNTLQKAVTNGNSENVTHEQNNEDSSNKKIKKRKLDKEVSANETDMPEVNQEVSNKKKKKKLDKEVSTKETDMPELDQETLNKERKNKKLDREASTDEIDIPEVNQEVSNKKRKKKLDEEVSTNKIDISEVSNHETPNKKKKKSKLNKAASSNETDISEVSNQETPNKIKSKLGKKVSTNESALSEVNKQETSRKKKRKVDEEISNEADIPEVKLAESDVSETVLNNGTKNGETLKFNIKATILSILEKKGTISLKKLEKKVLSVQKNETGEYENEESIVKKVHKKLKKLPVQISEDQVCLVVE